MSEKLSQAKREKEIRHQRNLAGFSGYWHGVYYLLGRIQLSKEARMMKLKRSGRLVGK